MIKSFRHLGLQTQLVINDGLRFSFFSFLSSSFVNCIPVLLLVGGKQKLTAMLFALLTALLTGSSPVGGSSRIPDAHCGGLSS